MNLNIVYEDECVIICHKWAGMAVETAKIGEIDMVSQLKNYKSETKKDSYIGVIHRLDQPVEGLLVFAKTPKAAKDLSEQINQKEMKKHYLAILCGVPNEKEQMLSDYLLKNGRTNTSAVVPKNTPQAKKSELKYKILQTLDQITLAEVELYTGRHHQIRVQMAHKNLPLLNDVKYNKEFINQKGVSLALCAYKLSFRHPKTNKNMTFQIKPFNEAFTKFSDSFQ